MPLSIPTTCMPRAAKYVTASDPTKPADPVMTATLMQCLLTVGIDEMSSSRAIENRSVDCEKPAVVRSGAVLLFVLEARHASHGANRRRVGPCPLNCFSKFLGIPGIEMHPVYAVIDQLLKGTEAGSENRNAAREALHEHHGEPFVP